MKTIKIFLTLLCMSIVTKNYAVQDPKPHVVITIKKGQAPETSCDHSARNTRILLYNMVGLALGTTAYIISSSITNNLASRTIATVSLGSLPPLLGAACEFYACYKNR
jgi:hypothetical protein